MKKNNLIKLSESDLHALVNKSVSNVLSRINEAGPVGGGAAQRVPIDMSQYNQDLPGLQSYIANGFKQIGRQLDRIVRITTEIYNMQRQAGQANAGAGAQVAPSGM